jgi:hypothetical protein
MNDRIVPKHQHSKKFLFFLESIVILTIYVKVCLPHYQMKNYSSSGNHCKIIQMPLADRTVLQMDQTTFTNQVLLRHKRECRENTNLDSHFDLCPGGYSEKAAVDPRKSLHNLTGTVRDAF